jgi:hypothetical protein
MAAAAHAAAIGAATVGVELLTPKFFSGRIPENKESAAPREFIQDVVRRREKNGWDDEKTMQYVTGSLIGKAAQWFNASMPAHLTDHPTELVAFRTKFDAFKAGFCKEYGLADIDAVRTARNYDQQRPGEDNFDFVDRVYGMAHSSFKSAETKKVTLDMHPRLVAMFTLREGDPMPMSGDTFKELLQSTVEENARKTRQTSLGAYMSDTVRVVIASGLREAPLRAKVRRMLLQDKNAYEITSFVKEETLAHQPEPVPRTGPRRNDRRKNGNGNGNGNGVHAVDEAGSDAEQDADVNDDEYIDKVTAKPNGRRQRGGGKARQTSTPATTSKGVNQPTERKTTDHNRKAVQCGYCKKNGHTTERCFIKRFNDDNNAGPQRNFQTSAEPTIAAPRLRFANDSLAQQIPQQDQGQDLRSFASSGNANGLW